MGRSTSTKQQSFNPVEYKQEFMTLASTAPQEAAEVAMKWRERFVNQAESTRKGMQTAAEIGAAGLTAGGMGYLSGGWQAKRDAMIRDWEAGGAVEAEADLEEHPTPFSHPKGEKDPTKLFGLINKTLFGTLLLSAGAIFNVLGKKYTPVVRSAALGAGSAWAAELGRSWGYKRKEKALAEAPEEEAA